MFVSKTLCPVVQTADITLASLSDHHAIKVHFLLSFTKQKAHHWRFNTSPTSNDDFSSQFIPNYTNFSVSIWNHWEISGSSGKQLRGP